jgi:hypothetical protein
MTMPYPGALRDWTLHALCSLAPASVQGGGLKE